jgi:arsenate reductase-like glutaredoxin family protein
VVITISLAKQVHIYSVDTSAFYTDREIEIQKSIYSIAGERNTFKSEKLILDAFAAKKDESGKIIIESEDELENKKKTALIEYRSLYNDENLLLPNDIAVRTKEVKKLISKLNKKIGELKKEFRAELSSRNSYRTFRAEQIRESNIIASFESSLTRTLGMYTNQLYDTLIVVRVYYYEILMNLMIDGFFLNGEKFVCLTASAGQIRQKKVVFIKESLWMQHRANLMCGLTPEIIEAKGGTNRNKYLAYLALCNSATDPWPRFNIRKSIVVDDMETAVKGLVDYIDDKTFDITRQEMEIQITHTDGCGMMLPRVSKKNLMIRMPWVKGLLSPFSYDEFIREANAANPSVNHALVKDIYGEMHDVLAEDIEIIFTKSQFKMAKFYDNWHDYIAQYEKNGCTAGICNVEENYIPKAKTNYQVLQTLTEMSDDELRTLADKTVKKIENIASSRASKLEAFGATKDNPRKTDFQKCLLLYPELLSTPYLVDTLRMIKDSLVNDGRAGKLDIDGRYLFIVPDLYAFCEWLFLGDKNPKGMLSEGEVFCSQYSKAEKLDCLRSPHLYKEHVVRRNVIDEEKARWFTTAGVYISCHDLMSKILQCDFDGDKSLVVADPLFVSIAERNMEGVVPLQYKMGKAGATPLTGESLYEGMILAYTGGKIGIISNDVTKIENSECPDWDAVKILCAQGNFCIDYAKTLYKPEVPKEKQEIIREITKCKTPHFFIYAKGKTKDQVELVNNSVVNRLEAIIKNSRIVNKEKSKSKFNYKDLMYNKNTVENEEIVTEYENLYKRFRCTFNDNDDSSPFAYVKMESIASLSKAGGSPSQACDMLIHYLFKTHNSKRQRLFWLCFSDIVLSNLERNLAGTMYCANCGARIPRESNSQKLCKECADSRNLPDKTLVCIDCGREFTLPGSSKNKKRCPACQSQNDLNRYKKYNEKRA